MRRPGAGRKFAEELDPGLIDALEFLVEPGSRGAPMSPLRWTLKSLRTLSAQLTAMGQRAGVSLVGELLHHLGYSLQANAKVTEGAQHADRDGQFRYINDRVAEHLGAGQPVISVDCKKKELVGDFANGGAEWKPTGQPTRVQVHDFPDPELGKAIPMGCSTWPPTKGGSTSATTTTPPRTRSLRSRGGGSAWARTATPTPPSC